MKPGILKLAYLLLFISLIIPAPSFSQGWIVPERIPDIRQTDRFELEQLNIHAELVEQVADYQIIQTFRNRSSRQIEGIFYFPLPKGSQITDFSYIVDGKKMKGELLEKNKARKIYEDIVRQSRDPALLEYMSQDLFRASIFPIAAGGTCDIEIKFAQVLTKQDKFYHLEYPLFQKQHKHRIKPFSSQAKLSVNLELSSEQGIQHIYSPSHNVEVVRKNNSNAVAGFEGKIADIPNNVLQLFYQLGSDEVGLSIMTYKEKDEDGYFLFIASPEFNLDTKNRQPKDVLFVLDVSGSMQGEKIKQAKDALIYCIEGLHPDDRFNIIPFSTVPQPFRDDLQPESLKKEAIQFVQKLEARGGTNIFEALSLSLSQNLSPDRLFTIVFLTDGIPTIGIQDDNEILQKLFGKNRNNVRIFSFGLGYDVNTFLIDQIASRTNAVADYVSPGENIEMVVSSFYDKISSPVLTQVKLDWQTLSVSEVYPGKMPDLFKGSEIIVMGRYLDFGKGEVILSGKRENETFRYAANINFVNSDRDNKFIPPLWGSRKIGYLLNEIRMHGENKELIDEVVKLSREYGIVTPYTSYLAQEDEAIITNIPQNFRRNPKVPRGVIKKSFADLSVGKTGQEAVEASEAIQSLISTTYIEPIAGNSVRHVAGRTFIFENDLWREKDLDPKLQVLKIQYGSKAYFNLIVLDSDLIEILSLGEQIEFAYEKIIIRIGNDGESNLTNNDLKKRLKL